MNKRTLGTAKELEAAAYLEQQGYIILTHSFRCRFGEIDLIGMKDGYYIFIEVKYRSTSEYGHPSEAVNYKKQRRISNIAAFYLVQKNLFGRAKVRFDVVVLSPSGIYHYPNAFPYCGSYMR